MADGTRAARGPVGPTVAQRNTVSADSDVSVGSKRRQVPTLQLRSAGVLSDGSKKYRASGKADSRDARQAAAALSSCSNVLRDTNRGLPTLLSANMSSRSSLSRSRPTTPQQPPLLEESLRRPLASRANAGGSSDEIGEPSGHVSSIDGGMRHFSSSPSSTVIPQLGSRPATASSTASDADNLLTPGLPPHGLGPFSSSFGLGAGMTSMDMGPSMGSSLLYMHGSGSGSGSRGGGRPGTAGTDGGDGEGTAAGAQGQGSNDTSRPSALGPAAPSVRFRDVVGLSAASRVLVEICTLGQALHPALLTGVRRLPNTVLLYGPPGTGKTLLVQAAAAESGRSLHCITPSSVLSKWAGDSEKSLRKVFEAAAASSPSIIFMDEMDALTPRRDSVDDVAVRRLLSELLVLMTQAANNCPGVLIVGATNRIEDIDAAIIRRFDRKIECPLPDVQARFSMLVSFLEGIGHDISEEGLQELAEVTGGWNGADIKQLVSEAAMGPVRELLQQIGSSAAAGTDAASHDANAEGRGGANISAAAHADVSVDDEGADGAAHRNGDDEDNEEEGDRQAVEGARRGAMRLEQQFTSVRPVLWEDFQAAFRITRPTFSYALPGGGDVTSGGDAAENLQGAIDINATVHAQGALGAHEELELGGGGMMMDAEEAGIIAASQMAADMHAHRGGEGIMSAMSAMSAASVVGDGMMEQLGMSGHHSTLGAGLQETGYPHMQIEQMGQDSVFAAGPLTIDDGGACGEMQPEVMHVLSQMHTAGEPQLHISHHGLHATAAENQQLEGQKGAGRSPSMSIAAVQEGSAAQGRPKTVQHAGVERRHAAIPAAQATNQPQQLQRTAAPSAGTVTTSVTAIPLPLLPDGYQYVPLPVQLVSQQLLRWLKSLSTGTCPCSSSTSFRRSSSSSAGGSIGTEETTVSSLLNQSIIFPAVPAIHRFPLHLSTADTTTDSRPGTAGDSRPQTGTSGGAQQQGYVNAPWLQASPSSGEQSLLHSFESNAVAGAAVDEARGREMAGGEGSSGSASGGERSARGLSASGSSPASTIASNGSSSDVSATRQAVANVSIGQPAALAGSPAAVRVTAGRADAPKAAITTRLAATAATAHNVQAVVGGRRPVSAPAAGIGATQKKMNVMKTSVAPSLAASHSAESPAEANGMELSPSIAMGEAAADSDEQLSTHLIAVTALLHRMPPDAREQLIADLQAFCEPEIAGAEPHVEAGPQGGVHVAGAGAALHAGEDTMGVKEEAE